MTSLITKEQFRDKLIEFIEKKNIDELNELKEILEDKKNCTEDHPFSPGNPNLNNIKSTGEKAFQRAIFNGEYSFLDYKRKTGNEKVIWLDLELPVTLNKNPRRINMDLIGSLDGIPVLCELKYYEKSPSNHPIYAIVELLMYRYLIQCNYKKLDKYKAHHHLALNDFKWEVIIKNKFPHLLVVANKKYWDYWFEKISKEELVKETFKLGMSLDTNIHLFEAPDEDYIKQKGDKTSYNPTVTSKIWGKIKRQTLKSIMDQRK